MVVTLRDNYRGRKMRRGAVCFTDAGKLAFFIDYCPNCKGKFLMDMDEVREFARKFGGRRRTNPLKRLIVRLAQQWA